MRWAAPPTTRSSRCCARTRNSPARPPCAASSPRTRPRSNPAPGLAQCSPEEFATITALNRRYNEKFGFPFILAVKGYDRAGILREFARRVEHDRAAEFAECLAQIARITRFRLEALVTS